MMAAGLILFAGWGYSHETRVTKAYTPNNLMRQSEEAVPADKPVALSADKVVRLHVRGNSNEKADQDVKLEVRDALMASFGRTLLSASSVGEARSVLTVALPEVERVAKACLSERGFTYDAKATLAVEQFPDREYRTVGSDLIYLPAGRYTALVVDLGRGEGDNWWCVMYPPLCYFDLVQRAVLRYGGTADESDREVALIVDELSTKEVPVEVRSLLLDSIKSGIKKLTAFWTKGRPSVTGAAQDP